MNAYKICKDFINYRKAKGTLNVDAVSDDLTVLLLCEQITGAEFNELLALVKEDKNNVNT